MVRIQMRKPLRLIRLSAIKIAVAYWTTAQSIIDSPFLKQCGECVVPLTSYALLHLPRQLRSFIWKRPEARGTDSHVVPPLN